MTRHAWLAGLIAAALLACPPAFGAGDEAEAKPKKPAKPKKEKSLLRGEYQIMASVLEMDEAQKAKLVEALKANQDAFAKWKTGPEGRKLAELMKARTEARKAKDKEKLKQIETETAPLRDAARKFEQEARQRIMDVLTDEQKTRWAAFGMERMILRKFSRAELTDDQKKRIKDLCLAAVKEAPAGDNDAKARAQATRDLAKKVAEEVLTDTQRESLTKPAEKPEKPAKPKKPGKSEKEGTQ